MRIVVLVLYLIQCIMHKGWSTHCPMCHNDILFCLIKQYKVGSTPKLPIPPCVKSIYGKM